MWQLYEWIPMSKSETSNYVTSARRIGGVAKCDCTKNFARNSPADPCMPGQHCWNQSGTSDAFDKLLEGVNSKANRF